MSGRRILPPIMPNSYRTSVLELSNRMSLHAGARKFAWNRGVLAAVVDGLIPTVILALYTRLYRVGGFGPWWEGRFRRMGRACEVLFPGLCTGFLIEHQDCVTFNSWLCFVRPFAADKLGQAS